MKDFRFLLDHITSQATVKKEGNLEYVLKCYEPSSSFKWIVLSPVFRTAYPFVVSPSERMSRELRFFVDAEWEFFMVPRVIDVDFREKCIKREFIDGRLPDRPEDFELIGVALHEIHEKGYLMGDTKPLNYLIKGDTVYVIDAEQTIGRKDERLMAWDLAVLLFFTSYLFINSYEKFKESVEYLKRGYREIREHAHRIFDYPNFGLLYLMPAPHLLHLRRSLLNS